MWFCLLSISFLSFPHYEIGMPISCVQSGDDWVIGLMTGGSGNIRVVICGGAERDLFFARALLPPCCPDSCVV